MRRRALLLTFTGLLVGSPSGWALDQTVARMTGDGVKAIGAIDFDRLASSPFGLSMLQGLQADKEFDKLVEVTGFDPRRDLREIFVIMNGSPAGRDAMPLLLVRGLFDEGKIIQYATKHNSRVTTYQGFKVLTGDEGHPWVAMLGGLLAIGEPAQTKAALERYKSGRALDPKIAQRADALSVKYHAWGLLLDSPANVIPQSKNPNEDAMLRGAVVQGIEQVGGGVQFGSEIALGLEALTRSEADARALMDVISFFQTMARSNSDRRSGMASALDSMRIAIDGRTVRFSMQAPQADLERLFRLGRPAHPAKVRPAQYRH